MDSPTICLRKKLEKSKIELEESLLKLEKSGITSASYSVLPIQDEESIMRFMLMDFDTFKDVVVEIKSVSVPDVSKPAIYSFERDIVNVPERLQGMGLEDGKEKEFNDKLDGIIQHMIGTSCLLQVISDLENPENATEQ